MAPKPPASLVRYIRERRCVLFCGSGLSAAAKLPTWAALLRDMVRELESEQHDEQNLSELRRLIDADKLLEVADHCKEALGQRYYTFLTERLRGDKEEIPAPHRAIARMPFSAIVTTNYDKLLERSFLETSSLPKTPTHSDVDALGPLLFDGSFFILKAHGDIDHPKSLVLTARDFQEIIHANPVFSATFSAILLTKAILFVGYSLSDPDFRLLLDRQLTTFKGHVPERFALMPGVGKVERDVLWRSARIKVLSYEKGQHEEVHEFLQALLEEVRMPAEPAVVPQSARIAGGAIATDTPGAPQAVRVVPSFPDVVARTTTTLSIRLSQGRLQASVSGEGEPVEGLGEKPNWRLVSKLMETALRTHSQAMVLGKQLATWLPKSVVTSLSELPSDQTLTLKLSPEIELLPWELTIIADQFLNLRLPTLRAPVGVSNMARGYPMVRVPARVLLIGDPNGDDLGKDNYLPLPGARAEVDDIAALYRDAPNISCDVLVASQASFDAVANALGSGGYDVVHFAGHAWFEEDLEPFLMLSGGVKLRSGELRSLLSPGPPAILFLNSHFTAFTPPGISGQDVKRTDDDDAVSAPEGQRSFIEAATTAGVGVLIGTFSNGLDDSIARDVGVSLHKALLDGKPVANALHHSLRDAWAQHRNIDAAEPNISSFAYVMSGYGDIALLR